MAPGAAVVTRVIRYALIVILAAVFFFPVAATITNSFMTVTEIGERYASGNQDIQAFVQTGEGENTQVGKIVKKSVSLIPLRITLSQYYTVLIEEYKYLNMFWNSVKLSAGITVLHVFIAIITAYVFAKVEFRGRDIIFFIYIVVMMMPFQVTLLPNYILVRSLNLLDTYYSILLPGIFAPFGVFLMRQFMKYIPDEMIEAAVLESDSVKDLFITVIIPMAKPGIIALTVLTFAENWNMVEQPLIYLSDALKHPLSLALNSIIKSNNAIAFAGSVIYMMPIIILFLYFEEYIIQGLENSKL